MVVAGGHPEPPGDARERQLGRLPRPIRAGERDSLHDRRVVVEHQVRPERRVRLNEVPNSCPITYSVNGKQYVAVTVGTGSAISTIWPALVPEMQNPPGRGGSVWVFELSCLRAI